MSGLWLNLGCGDNRLPAPWQNYDAELDVTKPLPFKDGEVQYILIEHCVEHVTCAEAYKFFEEAFRILQKGGVLRVAVPDVCRIEVLSDFKYERWIYEAGFGAANKPSAIKNIAVNHGHKSLWTYATLRTCFESVGFDVSRNSEYGASIVSDLNNIEGHHKVIGNHAAWVETTVVEAVK